MVNETIKIEENQDLTLYFNDSVVYGRPKETNIELEGWQYDTNVMR